MHLQELRIRRQVEEISIARTFALYSFAQLSPWGKINLPLSVNYFSIRRQLPYRFMLGLLIQLDKTRMRQIIVVMICTLEVLPCEEKSSRHHSWLSSEQFIIFFCLMRMEKSMPVIAALSFTMSALPSLCLFSLGLVVFGAFFFPFERRASEFRSSVRRRGNPLRSLTHSLTLRLSVRPLVRWTLFTLCSRGQTTFDSAPHFFLNLICYGLSIGNYPCLRARLVYLAFNVVNAV